MGIALCYNSYDPSCVDPFYRGSHQQRVFEGIELELPSAPVLCVFDVRCRHKVLSDPSRMYSIRCCNITIHH